MCSVYHRARHESILLCHQRSEIGRVVHSGAGNGPVTLTEDDPSWLGVSSAAIGASRSSVPDQMSPLRAAVPRALWAAALTATSGGRPGLGGLGRPAAAWWNADTQRRIDEAAEEPFHSLLRSQTQNDFIPNQ